MTFRCKMEEDLSYDCVSPHKFPKSSGPALGRAMTRGCISNPVGQNELQKNALSLSLSISISSRLSTRNGNERESREKKNKKHTHTNKQGHPLSRILLCKTLVREGLLSERCEVGQSFADSTAVIRKKLTASSPISLSSFFSFYYFCFTRRFVTNRDSSV